MNSHNLNPMVKEKIKKKNSDCTTQIVEQVSYGDRTQ